eukprot:529545_1
MFRLTSRSLRNGSSLKSLKLKQSTPSLSHIQNRLMEFPDYHPTDLRYYHLTEDEHYALERMDNLADIPFPMNDLPGFSAAPRYLTETLMKDEWVEYMLTRIQDMEGDRKITRLNSSHLQS